MLDHHAEGVQVAEYFIGRGFMHLALLQCDATSWAASARQKGFQTTIALAGRQFHSLVPPIKADIARPDFNELLDWLTSTIAFLPTPLAVFVEEDEWAVELIYLCQRLGRRIPDDVAVIGVNNDPLAFGLSPIPLSSIERNQRNLGLRAAELLDRLISGESIPQEPILVPPLDVVERQSSSSFAIQNEDVARARLFIQSNLGKPISVEDVAHECGTSRRRLQDLFFDQTQRSIAQEIRRMRLDLVKKLLTESNLKLKEIAQSCGMRSRISLAQIFSREVGMSPGEYRQRTRPSQPFPV
jgi:LacI family transcriptional regulator